MLPVLLSGLTGLAALGQVSAQDSDVITDDTYFYGQSPLVAPRKDPGTAGLEDGVWS